MSLNSATVALVAIAAVAFYWLLLRKEKLVGFYIEQLPRFSTDPINIKYNGRVDDNLGMSPKDYFLENDLNYRLGTEHRWIGDSAFKNHQNWTAPVAGRALFNVNASNMV
jgi:hypothetical protein